ncbi:hypothetical protein, partial [Maribacter arcticus]|uniref:hypothetical protein n=1 Tax=Maribacter arcticus TaxID=561365 RepID=UPI00300300BB
TGSEFTVADAGITPIKIQPSAITGQFLSTDALGNVVWDNIPISAGITATDVDFNPYLSLEAIDTQSAIEELKDELNANIIGGGGNPTDELQNLNLSTTILTITNPATVGNQIDLDLTFATDNELLASISDGSETIIDPSATVTVAGTGTIIDPYVLTATASDGSETVVNGSATVAVTGTGTTADPYILTSADTSDGSETVVNGSATVSVAGTGTIIDPYVLTATASDGSETVVNGSATVAVTGTGTTADP